MLPVQSTVMLLLELVGAGSMALVGLAIARGFEKHLASDALFEAEAEDELVLETETCGTALVLPVVGGLSVLVSLFSAGFIDFSCRFSVSADSFA